VRWKIDDWSGCAWCEDERCGRVWRCAVQLDRTQLDIDSRNISAIEGAADAPWKLSKEDQANRELTFAE